MDPLPSLARGIALYLLATTLPLMAFSQEAGKIALGTEPFSAIVNTSFQVKGGKVADVKAVDVECNKCSRSYRKLITKEAIRMVGILDPNAMGMKDGPSLLPIKFSLSDDTRTGPGEGAGEEILYADKAYRGMPIKELRQAYPNAHFQEEPVFVYGVDGESIGLLVIEDDAPLFFVWTMDGEETIAGITILSPKITIDGDVRVGMTVQEFFAKHPASRLAIDSIDGGIEFAYVPGKKYRVEFLTTTDTRVGRYDSKSLDPEFIDLERPDATVDRISL